MWGKVLADYLPGIFFCLLFILPGQIKLAGKSQVIISEFHAFIYDCPVNRWAGLKCCPFLPDFRRRKQNHFYFKNMIVFYWFQTLLV